MKAKISLILMITAGLLLITGSLQSQNSANATIVKTKDGYNVRVNKPGLVWVNVYMEKDGRQYFVGQKPFRVRYLPSPYAAIAGKRGGSINKNLLNSEGRITAILDNVDFDVHYKITSYRFSAKYGDFSSIEECKGAYFPDKVKKIIKHSKPGAKLYFEDIKAVGPDNVTRNIGTISFTVS